MCPRRPRNLSGLATKAMKILIVEDDRKLGQFIQNGFKEQAYAATLVASLAQARAHLSEEPFDVVILDLGLPDGNGLELLVDLSKWAPNCSTMILSARGEVGDRVAGLNQGADDYLSKPFSFSELLARVRSVSRRKDRARGVRLSRGVIEMDLETRTVTVGARRVDLSQREYALLEYLLRHAGHTLTRTQIAESIWDCHFDMETNLIDVYIRKLRNKLSPSLEGKTPIKTVRGVGYCLE